MFVKMSIPGECIPQPRHKVGRGFGGHARAYIADDHPVHTFKLTVNNRARLMMAGRAQISEPLRARFLFLLPRPKSYKKSSVCEWRPTVPDIDNLVKSVLDACKGVVFADDSQVVASNQDKVTAPAGTPPGLYVSFESVGDCEESVKEFFELFNRVTPGPAA